MAVHEYPFPSCALDLDPRFAQLQQEEPLARVQLPYGGEAWLATRYGDVRAVLSDPRFSRAATVGRDVPRVRPEIDEQSSLILNMDPPEQTRLCRLVAKAFTPRRVEELRPRAAALTAEMLAGMRAAGPGADLVAHVSMPMPVTIICELLGVPYADRARFRGWAEAVVSTSAMTPEQRLQAGGELFTYVAELIADRRAAPTDDLLGALVAARDEDELIGLAVIILIAGHETTMNQIGNMTFLLLSMPDRGAALRTAPSLAAAVEELLRFTPLPASAGFPRIATEDVHLSGVTIRAGEAVVLAMHAANRDPAVFTDAQDLVLDRQGNHHVAFGYGPHHCVGAQLARMELQEAIGGLRREFLDLRLAVAPEDIEWRQGGIVRGPVALPLAWAA